MQEVKAYTLLHHVGARVMTACKVAESGTIGRKETINEHNITSIKTFCSKITDM